MLAFPPDFTFVIQLVSFFVLLAILQRLLFKPFGELLAERERRTEGETATADADQAEAERLRAEFEQGLVEARTEAAGHAEAIRRETRQREAGIFDAAKAEAASKLGELRAGISKEREQAETHLRGEAEALARRMVDAVLG